MRAGAWVAWTWAVVGSLSAGASSLDPPRLLRGASPSVAPSAPALVLLDVQVNADGSVTQVRPLSALTPQATGLQRAVEHFRFRPARAAGEPVEAHVLVAGYFASATPAEVSPPAVAEGAAARAELARPLSIVAPAYPPTARGEAAVTLDLRVSPEGQPTSASVIESATGFDDAARAAARAWRFAPSATGNPRSVVIVFVFREPAEAGSRAR